MRTSEVNPQWISRAVFSRCGKYRYSLYRIWNWNMKGTEPRLCLFVMLNPSTADEFKNDPTVARCQERAIRMNFDGFAVVNIFALISTNPKALYEAKYPVGPLNNQYIRAFAESSKLVVCGWGSHGNFRHRGAYVLRKLLNDCKPHALKINADGTPKHPLYVSYDVKPEPISRGIAEGRRWMA